MTELTSYSDQADDLERLIQSAGGYVQPSEDLRPRVLETARTQRREQAALWRIVPVALLLVCLITGASSAILYTQWPAAIAEDSPHNASRLREPPADAPRRTDPNWETVEAFRNLRVRQARLFPTPF